MLNRKELHLILSLPLYSTFISSFSASLRESIHSKNDRECEYQLCFGAHQNQTRCQVSCEEKENFKVFLNFGDFGNFSLSLAAFFSFNDSTRSCGLEEKKKQNCWWKKIVQDFFFCSSQSLFFCGKEERNKKWTFIKNAVAADYVNICGKVVVMFALHHHHRFVFRGYWKNSQLSTCQHLKSALNLHRAAIFIKCKMMK